MGKNADSDEEAVRAQGQQTWSEKRKPVCNNPERWEPRAEQEV